VRSPEDIIPLNAPPRAPPPLFPGDPAPWFKLASDVNEAFQLSAIAGRTIVLTFLNSLSQPQDAGIVAGLLAGAERFRPFSTALLIVSADPADIGAAPPEGVTGVRYLYDPERLAASLFGVAAETGVTATTFLIDARLKILAVSPLRDAATHATEVLTLFDRAHRAPRVWQAAPQAPVLIIPHVFEPKLCRTLIEGHEKSGGQESGFMVEREGKTVQKHDFDHKRRRDWAIEDQALIEATRVRIKRRIAPEIWRAHQFAASRIERYLVACYEAETGGHFAPHRDNTTKGTAHRRFAVSVNLNDDYDGGDLVFPEFGQARFRPPAGGACVFSCTLFHQATLVTRGKRYVFVPFLYDDAAAAVREANLKYLE
jgi:predicted 2-oxoglutarate/Fe(II)-dependent dioxygenase YbiX/peroxiredoxin